MGKISSLEIKNKFLSFFKDKDHMEISDSSVVPKNDPTLLFINSGMAPIKNYFTGVETPPYPRLCDIQPCIRTIDIDSIGDKHHLTSFQMLGSWSINDYFKEKAIALAFEFLTESLNIPKEKLYVTVFAGDDEMSLPVDMEAYEYWQKVGMPEDHIVKCGKEDNFWGPTAETGPCGPCTEIFYDTGEGEGYEPGREFDTKKRYIEIWNAGVFMQLNKNADGSYSKLSFTSVDTGAGLERLSMVLNGCSSVYDTDLLSPIKKFIKSQLPAEDALPEKDVLIITDHMRTTALILSEKVSPSNEGRGYIPRKLIRRCMMMTAKNKVFGFDFSKVIEFIIDSYSDMFPKFAENREYIIKELKKEQTQFEKVLESGLERLEHVKYTGHEISAGEAFDLVTTYGLPFDIIKSYAEENNMTVDEPGFEKKLEVHKEKSRNVSESSGNYNFTKLSELLTECSSTQFVGYENLGCEASVLKIIKENTICESASENDDVCVVLDKSCLYAESGGQCADAGYIYNKNCRLKINDVKKTSSGVFAHFGTVESGTLKKGDGVYAEVDELKRKETAANHTAVHLLHSALRALYGKNVHQAGSRVEDKKLRFDFNYDSAIKDEEIREIEGMVNSYIRLNVSRKIEVKSLSDAIASGAMALFENKYGDSVRVVSYGDISDELCGGTHTERTGDIGLFIILSAEGIGKGLKRITAVTGSEALNYVQGKIRDINALSKLLKARPENLIDKVKKELLTKNTLKPTGDLISEQDIEHLKTVSGINLCYATLKESNKKIINEAVKTADKINGIFVCAAGHDKKQIVIAVSDAFIKQYPANEILSEIMSCIGGKGGGNKKLATGGSTADENKMKSAVIKIFSKK
jgi:alanyl-tRNA synthetase